MAHIFFLLLTNSCLMSYVLLVVLAVSIAIFEYKKRTKFFNNSKRGSEDLKGPWQIPVLGNVWQLKGLICQNLLRPILIGYQKLRSYYADNPPDKSSCIHSILGKMLESLDPGAPNVLQRFVHIFNNSWSQFGGVCRIWLIDQLYIVVMLPEYFELILGNVRHVHKSDDYKIVADSPLGGGLITQLDETTWRLHRKIITPAFHFNNLKTYIPVFHEETCILLAKIEKKFGSNRSKACVVSNIYPLFQLSNFDMILSSIFGVQIHAQAHESHSFLTALNDAYQVIQNRLFNPVMFLDVLYTLSGYKSRLERAKRTCHDFTESVIRQKRLEDKKPALDDIQLKNVNSQDDIEGKLADCIHIPEENALNDIRNDKKTHEIPTLSDSDTVFKVDEITIDDEKGSSTIHSDHTTVENQHDEYRDIVYSRNHKSFLDLIIEDEENQAKKMTDEEIRDNMITLMFAGLDTTASSNCLTLLMLATHQDVQERALKEVDDVFGGPGADDGHVPSYSELMDLQLLDRVIKESTRLYPAAPLIGRAVTEDTAMGPYILPKGSVMLFPLLPLHRDPRFHPRPNEFWPDRFLPPNTLPKFSFIPFSAGSRNCVGQKYATLQMKVVLSTILRKYRVSTEESIRSVLDVDDLLNMSMTISVRRCPLTLTRRQD